MEKQQTHDEVMAEIESIKYMAAEAIELNCIGDMMTFMDKVKYPYFIIGGETDEDTERDNKMIRDRFKVAVLKELAGLWGMARSTYEKEIYGLQTCN